MKKTLRERVVEDCFETNFWTWSAQKHVDPIPIEKAEGVHFWDFNGKRYLDFNSMVMCVNIGHGNQEVIESICDQLRTLPFAGPHMATSVRAELGKKLRSILPKGLEKFLYTLGGADANENAIKLARAYTGKHKILSRYRSYHGATHGAMALSGDQRRKVWEPNLMPGVVHFLDPYRYRSTFHQHCKSDLSEADFSMDYLNHLEEIIHYEGPETIAAILLETITGTNGIIIPPEGYLAGVRYLCDKYNILMITDEVMSGFGRTGAWFGVDHWQVTPDILTMAKGMTSGYAPLGAVAMRSEIAAYFDDTVYYGGLTYNGHPVSLAAACAVIDFMKKNQILKKASRMGEVLKEALNCIKEDHVCVGEVRSIGLFAAIELVKNPETREPLSPFNQRPSKNMRMIHQSILEAGVFIYAHFNTLLIIPPLIISEQELFSGLSVIDEALVIGDNCV
jgi:taurine---2-oxoglutarate transaminase